MSESLIYMDIETRSAVDLKSVNSYRYLTDPSTEAMCIVWKMAEKLFVWSPIELPDFSDEYTVFSGSLDRCRPIFERLAEDAAWVAHNANGFDRLFWELNDLPEPTGGWIDSMQLARLCGLPGGLDRLGQELLGRKKLKAGQEIMMTYSKDLSLELTPASLGMIIHYCVEDVELTEAIYPYVRAARNIEATLREADYGVNSRGFAVDVERVRSLLSLAMEYRERAVNEVQAKFGLTLKDLRSPKVLLQWFHDNGYSIPNVQRATLAGLTGDGAEVAEAREQVQRASFGKFSYILDAEVNGRLQMQLSYYGAHTGRWAGRGVQPQNLPRGVMNQEEIGRVLESPVAIENVRKRHSLGDIFSSLIRPCIVAGEGAKCLAIYDWSSVEVRGVDWVARELARLAEHERNEDPYVAFVKTAFGLTVNKKHPLRKAVKPVVLGCGYGMGPGRLEGYAEGMGIDLSETGRSAEKLVDLYRDTRPLVAGEWHITDTGLRFRKGGLWKGYQKAAMHVIEHGGSRVSGRCGFSRQGRNLVVELPSGRPIVYRRARLKLVPCPWGMTKAIHFQSVRGYEDTTHGRVLTENIVQGICRDLLGEAIVRCENEGLRVVLHIHDEIIIEVMDEEDPNTLKEIMTMRPSWAKDFPLHVEGLTSPHFLKD